MDIFEDMRQEIGCTYISDLHHHQYEVFLLFRTNDYSAYSKKQLEDLCQYIFGMKYDDFKKDILKEQELALPKEKC